MICDELIKEVLGGVVSRIDSINGNRYVHINSESLLKCMSILSSSKGTQFLALTDCFAVDFLKEKGVFSVYYQLRSYEFDTTIFVVTDMGAKEQIQSLTEIFENANWYEREIFDMFGIKFSGHPNMTRLFNENLVDEFPLLKR
ncbi:MAG: NADH-quinone oxidoreductase subunit C [Holosporales bacterium]|jgi:NADH:ubiquinone oxidoreductase subunit C|nr:NADH-quinone oxidoreductase subunit C [Holosporales bacterium]